MAQAPIHIRLPEEDLPALDAARGTLSRQAWILALAARETGAAAGPVPAGDIGDGIPAPGTVCFTPGCFNRDTRLYGLRHLPQCTACAYALRGQEYRRPMPPGASRAAGKAEGAAA